MRTVWKRWCPRQENATADVLFLLLLYFCIVYWRKRHSLSLCCWFLTLHYNRWEFRFHKVITIQPQIIHLVKSIFGTEDKVGAESLHTSGEGSLLVMVSRSVNAPMRKGLTGCIFLQTVPRKNQFPDFHVVSIMEAWDGAVLMKYWICLQDQLEANSDHLWERALVVGTHTLASTWHMWMICSNLCIWTYLPQNFLTVVVPEREKKRERDAVKHISAHLELKQFKSLTLLNLLS